MVGDCEMNATPYFVFDEEKMLGGINEINAAVSRYWNNTVIGYSVKTNSLPALASFMLRHGVYAEIVSSDEYDMVGLCGYKPPMIVCNGPVKTRSFVEEILEKGCILNIDSHREVGYILDYADRTVQDVCVGVRVNLDIESAFPGESNAGVDGSRFGFSLTDEDGFESVVRKFRKHSNIKITGLHLHVSTKTRSVEIYRWLVRQFKAIVSRFGLKDISYLDIGGGFFGGIPSKPNWNDYISNIADELALSGFSSDCLTLIIEPGVSLLAGAFSYYASVVDIKHIRNNALVVLDGSRIHVDPLFHKQSYFYKIHSRAVESEDGFDGITGSWSGSLVWKTIVFFAAGQREHPCRGCG